MKNNLYKKGQSITYRKEKSLLGQKVRGGKFKFDSYDGLNSCFIYGKDDIRFLVKLEDIERV
jgi:hypothetical protein